MVGYTQNCHFDGNIWENGKPSTWRAFYFQTNHSFAFLLSGLKHNFWGSLVHSSKGLWYTHTHTCTHTYVYIYIYTYIHTQIHIYIYIYLYLMRVVKFAMVQMTPKSPKWEWIMTLLGFGNYSCSNIGFTTIIFCCCRVSKPLETKIIGW